VPASRVTFGFLPEHIDPADQPDFNTAVTRKPSKNRKTDLPILPFKSAKAWEAWLVKHHQTSPGVWIQFAKKVSGIKSVTYSEALDVALCYGWIDGQLNGLDERFYIHRFTPRGPRSKWSKINRKHAARLIEAGRMRAAGMKQIEAAQADGRWDAAYDSPKTAAVPDDFRIALDQNSKAKKFFATLSGANRYAILYRLQDAKRPETRSRRIEKLVTMLIEEKTFHG